MARPFHSRAAGAGAHVAAPSSIGGQAVEN